MAKGLHKDSEYTANCIIPAIRELPNPLAVDLLICDGASDMTRFRALIGAVFPWILSIWCVSHIVNRILARIGAIERIAELIRKGKVIVDCFGSSKHFEHALFESKCHDIFRKRRALLRYCETRFGLFFIMLHRLLQMKDVLIACVTCPEWLARHGGGPDEVKGIIMDAEFWKDVRILIIVVWPLIQLLRLGDSDKPTLVTVYKTTFQIKARFESIRAQYEVEYIDEVIEAHEEYEDALMSDAAKVPRFYLLEKRDKFIIVT